MSNTGSDTASSRTASPKTGAKKAGAKKTEAKKTAATDTGAKAGAGATGAGTGAPAQAKGRQKLALTPADAIGRVIALMNEGKLRQAEHICNQIIQARPKWADRRCSAA